jgi:hypothetical protein
MDRPHLDYSPRSPTYGRWRRLRLIGAIVVLLLLIPVGWRAAPRVWNHIQVLYWQRKAMNYSPPADQVVYEDEPVAAALLLTKSGYSGSVSPHSAMLMARPWDRFDARLSPPGAEPAATLFLHELRNSAGQRRLVVVQDYFRVFGAFRHAVSVTPSDSDACYASGKVFRPGAAFSSPVELSSTMRFLNMRPLNSSKSLRWYAGQADPKDPSHLPSAMRSMVTRTRWTDGCAMTTRWKWSPSPAE